MKLYKGRRRKSSNAQTPVASFNDRVLVTADGRLLDPRLDLWNHSPTGFEWGYSGSGPAQLALALLADHLNDDEEAVRLHQEFKQAVVANLDRRSWRLTGEQIQRIVNALKVNGSVSMSGVPNNVDA